MGRSPADELQTINGETGHKYFHQMLNTADDDLDAYEYRLLGHYLRWAGHGGSYQEGIRQTAKTCHMSPNTIRKTRGKLVEKGWLEVDEPSPEQIKEGEAVVVTVVDRWAENIARYAKKDTPGSNQTRGGSNQTQDTSETRFKSDTAPGSNQTRKEELGEEHKKQEEQKEPAPIGGEEAFVTHRQKTDLIKAWWDALPEINRPNINPAKMYGFSTYLDKAERLVQDGIIPAKVAIYVKSQTTGKGHYQDKALHFGTVANNVRAWCAVHYRPPQTQQPDEFVHEDDLDPFVSAELDKLVKALSA